MWSDKLAMRGSFGFNAGMKPRLAVLFLLMPCLLGSCGSGSSSSRSSRKSLADMSMSERRSRSMKALQEGSNSTNPEYRSRYDKAAQSVLSQGKRGSAAWFSRQKHSAHDFNGVKTFSTGNEFSTKTFSGADNQSWMGRQQLSERDKVPSFADNQFNTQESNFANGKSSFADKTFSMGDEVFKTTMNQAATKSQKKNKLPQIIELPEQAQGSAYTEDQVKKLLGR